MFEKVKELAQNKEQLESLYQNRAWIHENFNNMCGNFPNKWVVVNNKHTELADIDLAHLFNIIKQRGDMRPTTLFVYCANLSTNPIILMPENTLKLVDGVF